MASIATVSTNILESSTVTLSTGTAAAGYPLYRLHDRDIGRMFAGSAATTTVVHVDQGGSPVAIDRLLVPSGHNLAGVTLDIEWSTDNVNWTPAVAQWTGAAGNIEKSWSALTKRYWRFTMTSPAAAPQFAELFLGPTVTWTRDPQRPGGNQDDVHQVAVAVSATGRVKFETAGPSLRQRAFTLFRISSAQRTALEALWSSWAGSKPFWLYDHEGALIFVRFTAPLALRETAPGAYDATAEVIEVPA